MNCSECPGSGDHILATINGKYVRTEVFDAATNALAKDISDEREDRKESTVRIEEHVKDAKDYTGKISARQWWIVGIMLTQALTVATGLAFIIIKMGLVG
jgi:hypothetical protein